MTSQRRTLTLVVMCVGMFLVLLDVTIVNVALPRLRAELGAGVRSLQWIVDGYGVALAALMLPCADLGDRHGHKRVVLAGLAVFATGSLAAGLAPGPAILVGGRIVQGAGAALLLPGTLAVVSRAYDEPAERARAIGIWAAISSSALPAGAIAGGALVQGPGWRWAFLVNLPVVAVALPAAALIVRETREPSGRRPDVAGTVLAAALLGTATYALIATDPLAAVAAAALLVGLIARGAPRARADAAARAVPPAGVRDGHRGRGGDEPRLQRHALRARPVPAGGARPLAARRRPGGAPRVRGAGPGGPARGARRRALRPARADGRGPAVRRLRARAARGRSRAARLPAVGRRARDADARRRRGIDGGGRRRTAPGWPPASTTPPARPAGRSGSPPSARSPGARRAPVSSTASTRSRWAPRRSTWRPRRSRGRRSRRASRSARRS